MEPVNPICRQVQMPSENQPAAPTPLRAQQTAETPQNDPEGPIKNIKTETEEKGDGDFGPCKHWAEVQEQQGAKSMRHAALAPPERLREDGQILQRRIEASEESLVVLQKSSSVHKTRCFAKEDCL